MLAKHKAKWAILNPGATMSSPRTTRRFETTSLSGTESVASRRGEVPDRATMVKELEERKRNNTRSSLFFGSTKILYESDAMRRQKDIFGKRMEEKHNKELRRELTATHFKLGDDPVVYKRASTLPDPTGSMSNYTGVLNAEVRDLIKNARLHFGSTPTVYRSMAREQMDSQQLLDGESMEEQREKNRMLKVFLTGTHFSLGDEDVDWITDHQRGFQYDPKKAKMAENKGIAKELKADLRRTHFSLGNDECDWQTDTMRRQKAWTVATSEEMRAQRERNKELRRHLQGNSYEIGTDEDYM